MDIVETHLPSMPTATRKVDLRQSGLHAYANGNLTEARDCFLRALEVDPLDADTLADLGALAVQSGAIEEALRWNRRALVLEPRHDAARYAIASAFRIDNRTDAAIAALRALLDEPGFAERAPDLALAARNDLDTLLGRPAVGDGIFVVDPRALMLGKRMDVVVKYLYARHRLGLEHAGCGVDARRLYVQHIHLRTGGQEPGDELRKGSMGDFIAQFDTLIDAMAESGFDPAHPIPISNEDGLPLNGSHRIATALAVGCDIAMRLEPGPGGLWDLDWFRRHGFAREDRNLMLRTWAGLKPDHAVVVLLWSPVEERWPQIESLIDEAMPIVDARTIEMPRESFEELVHDIYSFDWGPRTGANIARKIGLLSPFPARLRVIFCERPVSSDGSVPRDLKMGLRDSFAEVSPVDHFTTLHVSESAAETAHLMEIFANENNLMRLRQRKALRPELIDMLIEMRELLAQRDVRSSDCCIVGSAVLEVLGLRNADDVDFTLRSALRFSKFDGGVTHLSERVDVVSFNYPRSFSSEPAIDDDQLIGNAAHHFFVRGMRFADPRIVMTRKQHQRREKDLRDVSLLGAVVDELG